MAALTNQKHELFAKHLAKGESASEAYKAAGYRPCRQNASRLSSHDDIKQRVAEIKETAIAQAAAPPDMAGRDGESGQFVLGHRGPGRPIGSRNRLTEKFLHDLHVRWEQCGPEVLKRVSEADPVAFTKIVASVMPAKIDQTLSLDVDLFIECRTFAQAFRKARDFIGADANDPLLIEGNTH